MTRTSKRFLQLTLAAAAAFAALFATDRIFSTKPDALVATADARIGRPATPMSYAGVARRTVRRGAYVGAAGAAAAGAYYGSGCYQTTDQYGRVYTQCP
jgi:hypothetical protein